MSLCLGRPDAVTDPNTLWSTPAPAMRFYAGSRLSTPALSQEILDGGKQPEETIGNAMRGAPGAREPTTPDPGRGAWIHTGLHLRGAAAWPPVCKLWPAWAGLRGCAPSPALLQHHLSPQPPQTQKSQFQLRHSALELKL